MRRYRDTHRRITVAEWLTGTLLGLASLPLWFALWAITRAQR